MLQEARILMGIPSNGSRPALIEEHGPMLKFPL